MVRNFAFMGVKETQRSLWIAVKNVLLSLHVGGVDNTCRTDCSIDSLF